MWERSHLRRIANHFNRFYIRLALGSLIPQYTVSSTVLATGAFPTYFYNRNQQGSPTVMGVLGLGYGFMVHHFYLGAEAMLNAAGATNSATGLDILHNIGTKHTVLGTRFGIGIEKLFSGSFALTMNYIFTYYGHATVSDISPSVVNVSLERQDETARVGTHAVMIGVNYYFS